MATKKEMLARVNAIRPKVTNIKRTVLGGLDEKGRMAAKYEVELDGVSSVHTEVLIPKAVVNTKDPMARREKVTAAVLISALKDIEAALAAHA